MIPGSNNPRVRWLPSPTPAVNPTTSQAPLGLPLDSVRARHNSRAANRVCRAYTSVITACDQSAGPRPQIRLQSSASPPACRAPRPVRFRVPRSSSQVTPTASAAANAEKRL
jgi:hypothetical protein